MSGRQAISQPGMDRIDGSVERIVIHDRFLTLRYGREPGEYLVIYIPKNCFIHRNGNKLPLKDVQFCDNVSVRSQLHPSFGIQMAQEIEVY